MAAELRGIDHGPAGTDEEENMGFLKFIIAFVCMDIAAKAMGIDPHSKEAFLGVCMLLAGFIAYSDGRK